MTDHNPQEFNPNESSGMDPSMNSAVHFLKSAKDIIPGLEDETEFEEFKAKLLACHESPQNFAEMMHANLYVHHCWRMQQGIKYVNAALSRMTDDPEKLVEKMMGYQNTMRSVEYSRDRELRRMQALQAKRGVVFFKFEELSPRGENGPQAPQEPAPSWRRVSSTEPSQSIGDYDLKEYLDERLMHIWAIADNTDFYLEYCSSNDKAGKFPPQEHIVEGLTQCIVQEDEEFLKLCTVEQLQNYVKNKLWEDKKESAKEHGIE